MRKTPKKKTASRLMSFAACCVFCSQLLLPGLARAEEEYSEAADVSESYYVEEPSYDQPQESYVEEQPAAETPAAAEQTDDSAGQTEPSEQTPPASDVTEDTDGDDNEGGAEEPSEASETDPPATDAPEETGAEENNPETGEPEEAGSEEAETQGPEGEEESGASLEITEEELLAIADADAATDLVVDGDGVSLYPTGVAPSTLRSDDVSGSVAEAGYFPSKWAILNNRVPGIFTASMITWHRNNGAACYRIKDTTIFAGTFGGSPSYTPRAGDLIYYQAYQSEYDRSIITSGNANWLHVGIVAEVGENYILTIEGNYGQKVGQCIYYSNSYSNGGYMFEKSWIVDVFGEDEDARRAFVNTAWAAWYASEDDASCGRCGFGSWCESCYEGVYQNDTIASGYFQLPAAWCEMFVLWCAFHADIYRTGTMQLRLYCEDGRLLPTVISNYSTMEGYSFALYASREDGLYDEAEAVCTAETNTAGIAVLPDLPYGSYHLQITSQGAGGAVNDQTAEIVINAKKISVLLPLEPSEDDLRNGYGLMGSQLECEENSRKSMAEDNALMLQQLLQADRAEPAEEDAAASAAETELSLRLQAKLEASLRRLGLPWPIAS